jgi:hypothetical protein
VDDELYADFRRSFPDLDVKLLDSQKINSEQAKPLWREFIARWEKRVADFNYGAIPFASHSVICAFEIKIF